MEACRVSDDLVRCAYWQDLNLSLLVQNLPKCIKPQDHGSHTGLVSAFQRQLGGHQLPLAILPHRRHRSIIRISPRTLLNDISGRPVRTNGSSPTIRWGRLRWNRASIYLGRLAGRPWRHRASSCCCTSCIRCPSRKGSRDCLFLITSWLQCLYVITNTIPLSIYEPADFLRSKTVHYIYRALLAPLYLNPSMSPIHVSVWASALGFQLVNATNIGGWLAGYGPTTQEEWAGTAPRIEVGMMIFAVALMSNVYHDDELREIRRAAARKQSQKQNSQGKGKVGSNVAKVYMIPENGLFRTVLFPHYFCEWIEWCGFWMVGGLACGPARTFVINEVATMLPRALQGRRWYIERFGKDKIGGKRAVIPGVI